MASKSTDQERWDIYIKGIYAIQSFSASYAKKEIWSLKKKRVEGFWAAQQTVTWRHSWTKRIVYMLFFLHSEDVKSPICPADHLLILKWANRVDSSDWFLFNIFVFLHPEPHVGQY